MTDFSGKTCHEQKCLVCTRLMRSGDNHPGKCRSCHGCTIDHKCDVCSEWTDKGWTGIVEHTRARSSRKLHSTPAMSTDSPSLLTEPGGSSKRPRSHASILSSSSFRRFSPSPSPERFREDKSGFSDGRDFASTPPSTEPTTNRYIYWLSRHTRNIVLLAVAIGFRCRALRPSVPCDVIAPMAMSKTCDISSAPFMSASGCPALTWVIDGAVRTPCEWNPAGWLALSVQTSGVMPQLNFLVSYRRM